MRRRWPFPLGGGALIGGGSGPPNCEVDCADAIAAATAAGYASGLTDGAASVVPAWRSLGLREDGGDAPAAVYGSAYVDHTVNGSTGGITVDFTGGIGSNNPASAISLVWRAHDAHARELAARWWQYGALRAHTIANALPNNLRVGLVLLTDIDPTAARGWGVFHQGNGTNSTLGTWHASSAGSWVSNVASVGTGSSLVEGQLSQYRSTTGPVLVATRVGGSEGLANSDAAGALLSVSPPAFNFDLDDCYIAAVVGQNGTGVSSSSIEFRALAALLAVDTTDFVGVA